MEIVNVVDKDDQMLKTIDRDSASDNDILRVAGIFILKKEKILLQLRAKESTFYPGYWDCSAGGTWELMKIIQPVPIKNSLKK